MRQDIMHSPTLTIGLDVGDRYSRVCLLDERGEVIEEGRVTTTEIAPRRRFAGMERARMSWRWERTLSG